VTARRGRGLRRVSLAAPLPGALTVLSATCLRLRMAPSRSAVLADFGEERPWVPHAFASGWLAVVGAAIITLLSRRTTVGSVVAGVLLELATVGGCWVMTTDPAPFLTAHRLR
jgi:hypothetical protein